jgi:hypothetical protein
MAKIEHVTRLTHTHRMLLLYPKGNITPLTHGDVRITERTRSMKTYHSLKVSPSADERDKKNIIADITSFLDGIGAQCVSCLGLGFHIPLE